MAILRLRTRLFRAGRNQRIGIVAEHALVVNDAGGALIVRAVVAWIHPPVTTVLRVPAERQLLQCIPAGKMEISSCVVSAT